MLIKGIQASLCTIFSSLQFVKKQERPDTDIFSRKKSGCEGKFSREISTFKETFLFFSQFLKTNS